MQALAIRSSERWRQNAQGRSREMFGRRRRFESHGAMAGQGGEKIEHCPVPGISEKSVVPRRHDMVLNQRFDPAEIGDHALFRVAIVDDYIAADGYLNGIAMPVQMAALTLVMGNAVTGVEFEPAGDAHGKRTRAEKRAIIASRIGRTGLSPRGQREARPPPPLSLLPPRIWLFKRV